MYLNKSDLPKILLWFSFFIIGCIIYDDYGIPWDETAMRGIGVVNLNYIIKTLPLFENFGIVLSNSNYNLLTFQDRYYGPFLEIIMIIFDVIFRSDLEPDRSIYLIRHFFNFTLFSISLIFFYKTLRILKFNIYYSLFGCFILVTSPRIFANSFYNEKDLGFMCIYIITSYFLFNYYKRQTLTNLILLSIFSGILVDIRIMALILPFTFILFQVHYICISSKPKVLLYHTALFMFITILVIFLFRPILWHDPINEFINILNKMSKYPFTDKMLYLGKFVKPNNLPWHYPFVWITITTPILYLLFFIGGIIYVILRFKQLIKINMIFVYYISFIIMWLTIPLLSFVIFKPTLLDGWRHLYFIYPAIVIFSVYGFSQLIKFMKLKINTYKTPIFCMFYLVVTFSILDTIKFMVQYHPHQNVYFNLISKYPNKRIKLNYELDYWGLSYKQALEYILKYDLSDKIYVKSSNSPGIINAENFVKSEKRRLIFVKSLNEAQYYISNYRWHSNEYSFGENIYSILVNGENIMSVIYLKN